DHLVEIFDRVEAAGHDDQRRSQTLAAVVDDVREQFDQRGAVHVQRAAHLALDLLQVGAQRFENVEVHWPPASSGQNKRMTLHVVACATASSASPRSSAIFCATSRTPAGSLRLPRRDCGARNGASVSTSNMRTGSV